MIGGILGQKLDQSQTFDSQGKRMVVTRIKTGPCFVVGWREKKTDGYQAVCLGFGEKRKNLSRPFLGFLKKAGLEKNPPRFLREIKLEEEKDAKEKIKIGTRLNLAEIFSVGDLVLVTGISKGKGFQGVVKRHHFRGGPRTHGQSDRERAPGAIGQTTTPGRVYRGKRMAGRMGGEKVTVKNLKVVAIDKEKEILTLSGLVPGGRNSLLMIEKTKN